LGFPTTSGKSYAAKMHKWRGFAVMAHYTRLRAAKNRAKTGKPERDSNQEGPAKTRPRAFLTPF
jgi:hypothetical protein